MLTPLLKGLCRFFGSLPLARAHAIGRGLGWVYGRIVRYHRRDAIEALRRSLPELGEAERTAILDTLYRNLGMNLVEEFRLPSMNEADLRDLMTWDGQEHCTQVLGAGKGLLVLSAHTGNWDLLCTIAPKLNLPSTIITKRIKNRALNDFWMETRGRFGLKFVPAHHSYRQCLAALRKNEIVGFILDQNMIRTEGIFVDFFGKPACTSPGLAYMSAQSGAAVVPAFAWRRPDGSHAVKVLPPIPPPPDRQPETIRAYTQLYTRIIETFVREHPEQWIWIHRRWRTTPGEEAPGQQSA
jgi:KDO2-lipid IV(A) lauroyltransferase